MAKVNMKNALKQVVIPVAAVGAGAAGAAYLNKVDALNKAVSDPFMKGLLKVGLGAAGILFLSKGKNADVIKGLCSGMIAVGGLEAINSKITDSTKKLSIGGVLPVYIGYPAYRPTQPARTPAYVTPSDEDGNEAITGFNDDED